MNSDKEKKRKQFLDAKQLFCKEREKKIQIKEQGYFGIKLKQKNQSILNNYPERRISVLGGHNLNSANQQQKFFSSFLRQDDVKLINLKKNNKSIKSRKIGSKSSKNLRIQINLVNSKSQQRLKKKKKKVLKKCNSDGKMGYLSEEVMQKEDISYWGESININQSKNQSDLQETYDPRSLGETIKNSNGQFIKKFVNSYNNTPKNSIGPNNQELQYFQKLDIKSPQTLFIKSKMNSNQQQNNAGDVDQFFPQILNNNQNINSPLQFQQNININVQLNNKKNLQQKNFDANQIHQKNLNNQKQGINSQKTIKLNDQNLEQNKIEYSKIKQIEALKEKMSEQNIDYDYYERTNEKQSKSSNKKQQIKDPLQQSAKQTRNQNQTLIEYKSNNEEQTINTFQSIDTVIKGNCFYDVNINQFQQQDSNYELIPQDQTQSNLVQDASQIGLHLYSNHDFLENQDFHLINQDQNDFKYQTLYKYTENQINNSENQDKKDLLNSKLNIEQLINVRSQLASDQKYSRIIENLSEHIIKESFLEDFSQESSNEGNSLLNKINPNQMKKLKQANSSKQLKKKQESKNIKIQSQKQSDSSGKVSRQNVNRSFSETDPNQILKNKKALQNPRRNNLEQISLKKQNLINNKQIQTKNTNENNEIKLLKQEVLLFLGKQKTENKQQIAKQQNLFEKDAFPKLFEVDSENSNDENQLVKQIIQSQIITSPDVSFSNEQKEYQIIGKVKDQQQQINNDIKLQYFQTFAPDQYSNENYFSHNSNLKSKQNNDYFQTGFATPLLQFYSKIFQKQNSQFSIGAKQLNSLCTISEQQSIQNSQNQIQNIQQNKIVKRELNSQNILMDNLVQNENLQNLQIPSIQNVQNDYQSYIQNNDIQNDMDTSKILCNIDNNNKIQANFYGEKSSNYKLTSASQQTYKNLNKQKLSNTDQQYKIIDTQQKQIITCGDYSKQQKSQKFQNQKKTKNLSKPRASIKPQNELNVKIEKIKTTKQMVSEMLKNNLNQNPPIPSNYKQKYQGLNKIQQLQNASRQSSHNPFRSQVHEINNSNIFSEAMYKSPIQMNNFTNYEMKSISSSIYRSSSLGINQSLCQQPKKQNQALKFEIHIDQQYGQQQLEIYDKDNVEVNVDRFALKFGISSKSKISKLKKYIKSQFESQFGQPSIL